ncbi:hypothetical protein K5X82_06365 [Halosquirtibacter xylanolyticus]|uniref:arsenate reductase family protein n=1 Tax=Halosquirtibacter xylanolyticus TaxID=3374599 RepID=UPI0037485FFC|nr:hypothetical protein K5X82_06365 [Prolixibacteraceae bacterium]
MKFYYLSTCSTCKRIMNEVELSENVIKQDIKTTCYTEKDLDEMCHLAGSYEALFNKRAQKYKALDLKNKNLTEEEIKQYILSDYTFLKRPVFVDNNVIFIGNSKKTVCDLKEYLDEFSSK